MISKNKQYRTRDGREVRIYATDGAPDTPIHGAIKCDGYWESYCWNPDGSWPSLRADADLIEIRPRIKREYWVNVGENGEIYDWHNTKESADCGRSRFTKSCVKVVIDCEEGEGL